MSRSRATNAGVDAVLERASERREASWWLDEAWSRARVLILDREGRTLLRQEGGLAWCEAAHVATVRPAEAIFLGVAEDVPWFAVIGSGPANGGQAWIGLREAAGHLDRFQADIFAYARALALWHGRALHCGACGSPTEVRRAGHLRRCTAAPCGLEIYPRIDPAIIVLVRHRHRALLGRAPQWPERRFSTLAGFVEPGESLEDALRREVLEEVGVRIGRCSYRGSQPWPFPASLMVGYHAFAKDEHLRLGDELAEARWWEAGELLGDVACGRVVLPPPTAISYRLIVDWLVHELGARAVKGVLPRPSRNIG